MNTLRIPALALAFSLVFLAACGGDDTVRPRNADVATPTATTAETAVTATAPTEPAAPEAVVAYDGPAFEMAMTPDGNQMLFEQTEFTVAPGQTVRITFQNTATMPGMNHNVVFVNAEEDINVVGQAAMGAADTEYVPNSEAKRIIAYTPLAEPGETVTVEFTAPSTPGDYPYICTFPGHYMMMQGTMHVVA
jgi:azurin